MLQCVLQSCNQALILGEIIGLVAKIFAEGRDRSSGLVFDHHTVACRSGIAARTAITVSDQIVGGRIVMGFEKTAGVRCWHDESLIPLCFSVPAVLKNQSQSVYGRIGQRPAASRVASRGGSFAPKIRSCAPFRL